VFCAVFIAVVVSLGREARGADLSGMSAGEQMQTARLS
jgi:hypothetical protein